MLDGSKTDRGVVKFFKPFLEKSVLILLFVFTACLWIFMEVADEVRENESLHFDDRILLMFRTAENPAVPIGPKWLTTMAMDVTSAGSTTLLTFVILAVSGAFWLEKKHRAALLILTTTITGQILSGSLKMFFDRPRPDIVQHLTEVSTTSFPSGHSMMSAVVYLTIAAVAGQFIALKTTRIYLLFLAVVLMISIGISRMFLGVHYPTDVLAGWTAGFAWAILCLTISHWLQMRGAVEQSNTTS